MSSAIQRFPAGDPPGPGPAATARGTSIGVGAATAVVGLVMAALAVLTGPPLLLLLAEIALALAVAVPGVLIARVGVSGRHPLGVGVLLPEIVLAGALVYLAVAMPVFHAGGISYTTGLAQFLAVVVGLVLGSVGLVLAGATSLRADEVGRVSFPLAVRDGVIVIVGTIVVAIGTGQFAGAVLTLPKWNWISFAGITVPGMLILIAREMVKQAHRRHPRRRPLGGLVLTEAMLVVGLFFMVFGSIANLTLGANGYVKGLVGNTAGLIVLTAAAVFLVVVRGVAKTVAKAQVRTGRLGISGALLANLALAVGVIVFVDGERSVIVGKTPLPAFGAALPAAALIAIAGLLILIPGRVLSATDAAAVTTADDDAHSDDAHSDDAHSDDAHSDTAHDAAHSDIAHDAAGGAAGHRAAHRAGRQVGGDGGY